VSYGENLVIDRKDLFTEDQNHVAPQAQVADPDASDNCWHGVEFDIMVDYFSLERGHSCRLAVWNELALSEFRILDLATGEVMCRLDLERATTIPANWWGGNFFLLKGPLQSSKPEDAYQVAFASTKRIYIICRTEFFV